MGEAIKEATFSLAEANFAAGDFRCALSTMIIGIEFMYYIVL